MSGEQQRQVRNRRAFKVEVFVRHYLRDFNAARAARAAGFAAGGSKEQGYALLQEPDVKAEIERKQAELRTKLDVELDDILRELAAIAFARLDDVATWHGKRLTVLSPADIPERALPAIREISVAADGRITVKLHEKSTALITLGKHLGLKDTQRHEHSGPDGQPLAAAHPATIVYHLPAPPRLKAKPPPKASAPQDER
jgi:phage terminase small subunit